MPRVLRGSRGDAVMLMQQRLISAGFDSLEADGIFGQLTEKAVVEYQRQKGLDPDGICGQKTWAALCKTQPCQREYTVVNGDTLYNIAAKLLGNPNRWPEIQQLNGLSDTTIDIGQVLRIPGQ